MVSSTLCSACQGIYFFINYSRSDFSTMSHGTSQYDRCSTKAACPCLHIVGVAAGTGVCVTDQFIFTGLAPYLSHNNWCSDQTAICSNHPLCNNVPVC